MPITILGVISLTPLYPDPENKHIQVVLSLMMSNFPWVSPYFNSHKWSILEWVAPMHMLKILVVQKRYYREHWYSIIDLQVCMYACQITLMCRQPSVCPVGWKILLMCLFCIIICWFPSFKIDRDGLNRWLDKHFLFLSGKPPIAIANLKKYARSSPSSMTDVRDDFSGWKMQN